MLSPVGCQILGALLGQKLFRASVRLELKGQSLSLYTSSRVRGSRKHPKLGLRTRPAGASRNEPTCRSVPFRPARRTDSDSPLCLRDYPTVERYPLARLLVTRPCAAGRLAKKKPRERTQRGRGLGGGNLQTHGHVDRLHPPLLSSLPGLLCPWSVDRQINAGTIPPCLHGCNSAGSGNFHIRTVDRFHKR